MGGGSSVLTRLRLSLVLGGSGFTVATVADPWAEWLTAAGTVGTTKRDTRFVGGSDVVFPETQVPRVVEYDFGTLYSPLFTELQNAFSRATPLFVLPMYYPLAFSNDKDIDTVAENRQRQVVALIRTIFLKRFESSLAAFAGSCLDLSAKVLHWLNVNTKIDPDQESRLVTWRSTNEPTLRAIHDRYRSTLEEVWHAEDLTEEELNELEYNLVSGDYKLQEMIDAAFEDLDQLKRLMDLILSGAGYDDKYLRLRDLLLGSSKEGKKTLDREVFTPEFRTERVIVFTEFADTARYLEEQLKKDGLVEVDRIDGTRGNDRYAMIKRFAPFYNKVSAADRKNLAPLRVLVSTDVLSEGVNLQDGTLLVNYDIHWNPVRLMQRIGRVDRRMNPAIEAELVKEKPSAKKSRGHIQVRNFLPPAEIEVLLTLYNRVQEQDSDDRDDALLVITVRADRAADEGHAGLVPPGSPSSAGRVGSVSTPLSRADLGQTRPSTMGECSEMKPQP